MRSPGERTSPSAALAEVRAVYRDLAARPIERNCELRTQCCHFKLTGTTPYLTRGEALLAAHALKAKALLEHAWQVDVERTGVVPVDLGRGTYVGDVAHMRRSYSCLLNPANQTGIDDAVAPVICRLDGLLLRLLLKNLDCPFRREASEAGADQWENGIHEGRGGVSVS
jgi:hypothetical protein